MLCGRHQVCRGWCSVRCRLVRAGRISIACGLGGVRTGRRTAAAVVADGAGILEGTATTSASFWGVQNGKDRQAEEG